jgi:hypothetical protein
MDKFSSQQAALRAALTLVMGVEPKKGELVISDEQRAKVGETMMGWLKDGRWSIKDGTRAAAEPMLYITGKRPTDLIQAWTKPKRVKAEGDDRISEIKRALEAGIIDAETAKELALKHLMAS